MVNVELMNVHTDTIEDHGPYEFAQITYNDLRVGPDGADTIAIFDKGIWKGNDGREWTDITVTSI
jgi:hypothetical protein